MTKDEALKLALKALHVAFEQTCSVGRQKDWKQIDEAITAIKAALAQPEQEPVELKMMKGEICYLSKHDDQSFGMWCPVTTSDFPNETLFYATPPKRPWVGLTDMERDDLIAAGYDRTTMVIVESLLKGKNT